jgi:hypothetical protein
MYTATLVPKQGRLLLDMRDQPGRHAAIALGVPLWDALESLLAANDLPSLLQLAAYTFRRITRCERCVVYAVTEHEMGRKTASDINVEMDSAGIRADEGIRFLAESREDHVHDESQLIDCILSHVMRMRQAAQPLPPFSEENLRAEVVAMEYKEAASPEDVSLSTLFAASGAHRAAMQDRGLRQLLFFPLCDAEGKCWGAIAAYNYNMTAQWSLKDLTACESICSTTTTKLEMLQMLQTGARKSKLINLQHDLLDHMQHFRGVNMLKGLVSSANVSLLNVVRGSEVCPFPRLSRATPILIALPPFSRAKACLESCVDSV